MSRAATLYMPPPEGSTLHYAEPDSDRTVCGGAAWVGKYPVLNSTIYWVTFARQGAFRRCPECERIGIERGELRMP